MIGPGGVFTIKRHPQASVWVSGEIVRVNGAPRPYVPDSRHEASRAAKLLVVTTARDLLGRLNRLAPVLGGPSIARIFDVARHLATWQPGTVRWQDLDRR